MPLGNLYAACQLCGARYEQYRDGQAGDLPPACRHDLCDDCAAVLGYGHARLPGLIRPLIRRLRRLHQARTCEICRREFCLHPDQQLESLTEETDVPYLLPNLWANVCLRCFDRCFEDDPRGSKDRQLSRLRDLAELIRAIPQPDYGQYFFRFSGRTRMLRLIRVLQKLRPAVAFEFHYGSFFDALVAAGLLDPDARPGAYGTRVTARDGHRCFSLTEKEIDDFLSDRGVRHAKEVPYPGSRLKTDWELVNLRPRTFVEYAGLISQPRYRAVINRKVTLARECGIRLVIVTPEDDWRRVLIRLLG